MRYTTILVGICCILSALPSAALGGDCLSTCQAMCADGGELYDASIPTDECLQTCTSGCNNEVISDAIVDPEVDDATRCLNTSQRCETQCQSSQEPGCYQRCVAAEDCDF